MSNPEDIRRLEAIQSTISSDGWKYLVEDIEDKVSAMKEEFLNPSVSLELLRFGQGRISVYKEFISLKTVIDQVLDDIENSADEDSENG